MLGNFVWIPFQTVAEWCFIPPCVQLGSVGQPCGNISPQIPGDEIHLPSKPANPGCLWYYITWCYSMWSLCGCDCSHLCLSLSLCLEPSQEYSDVLGNVPDHEHFYREVFCHLSASLLPNPQAQPFLKNSSTDLCSAFNFSLHPCEHSKISWVWVCDKKCDWCAKYYITGYGLWRHRSQTWPRLHLLLHPLDKATANRADSSCLPCRDEYCNLCQDQDHTNIFKPVSVFLRSGSKIRKHIKCWPKPQSKAWVWET